MAHSMNGLKRNDLIDDKYTYGAPEHFIPQRLTVDSLAFMADERVLCEHGISFQPTPSGMELYLLAHGLGDSNHFQFLDESLVLEPIQGVQLPDNTDLLYRGLLEHFQNTGHQ